MKTFNQSEKKESIPFEKKKQSFNQGKRKHVSLYCKVNQKDQRLHN